MGLNRGGLCVTKRRILVDPIRAIDELGEPFDIRAALYRYSPPHYLVGSASGGWMGGAIVASRRSGG